MQYVEDPKLTWQENRKQAIALHERDGPMVPLVVGGAWDGCTSCWLFPDGAVLEHDPKAHPQDPYPRPEGFCEPGRGYVHGHWQYVETLKRIRDSWRIRLKRTEGKFAGVKAAALKDPTGSAEKKLLRLKAEVEFT